MGRFDALTTIASEPTHPVGPHEKPASHTTPPSSPLLEKREPGTPANRQTGLHANPQTSKDANPQTGKPVSMQTRKPASMQTGKQVNLQTGKQVFIEKYSSYLTHEYKRELKRLAFESDRNEYEVLMEAVERYLGRQK